MSTPDNFKVAERAERFTNWGFWTVTGLSAILVVFPAEKVEQILQPLLIVAIIASLVCGYVVGFYQNQGNRQLRASQLTDALGAAVGDPLREGYYNSPLPPSVGRLASTILENTLFTTAVLTKMLRRRRIITIINLVVFMLLLAYRHTSLSLLVLATQAVFSADVLLNWLRMERFRFRVTQVHEQLRQFFLQNGNTNEPVGMALALAAFTDYECAKDEAAMPLDGDIFNRINSEETKNWERMKKDLKIG